VDDIVAQTMLEILSRGNDVDPSDIGGLAYSIGRTLAKRTWDHGPNFIEPEENEDTSSKDVFDDLEIPETDEVDGLQLEKVALEVLTPDEQRWILEYRNHNGAHSAREKNRLTTLLAKCREFFIHLLDVL
jgi:hypothetical protein